MLDHTPTRSEKNRIHCEIGLSSAEPSERRPIWTQQLEGCLIDRRQKQRKSCNAFHWEYQIEPAV